MKMMIVAMAVLLTTATFAQSKQSSTKTHQHNTSATKYTCTMHPEVVKSKPGKCPKCGMDLVAMKSKKVALKGKAKS